MATETTGSPELSDKQNPGIPWIRRGIYAMYSVKRYFGMARAAGADHFDTRYRNMPLEKRGIFRFTSNGMYLYAFFLFWAIAVCFNSSAALAVAAFSHIYIWVHFYTTEKPDMEYLDNVADQPMQSDEATVPS